MYNLITLILAVLNPILLFPFMAIGFICAFIVKGLWYGWIIIDDYFEECHRVTKESNEEDKDRS